MSMILQLTKFILGTHSFTLKYLFWSYLGLISFAVTLLSSLLSSRWSSSAKKVISPLLIHHATTQQNNMEKESTMEEQ